MFETLTKGFRAAKARLTGKAELTGDVIDEALRDIRLEWRRGVLVRAEAARWPDVVRRAGARLE